MNKDLNNKEAVAKLKELAESARICMFCTDLDKQPIDARPMGLQEVDEQGNLWFISGRDSNKNFDIKKDSNVQLFFNNTSASEYLSVHGSAHIYTDRATIEEQWSAMANAWFDGKEDPNVSIIRVSPDNTYYWDTKNGKVVTMLRIAASAITGAKNEEGGVEGNLSV